MCGIAGIIDFNARIPEESLAPMLNAIRHRGPDAMGMLTADNFAAGMRRLSIIDLVTGDQPIYNENKTIFTFFNGEIYNYIELRKELERKGHKFRTQSDTEVIVHYYEEEGIDFVKRLNGMFAFMLADTRTKTFYLVRDHFGIKPLYYQVDKGRTLFASELKAILSSGLVEASVSQEGLINYFNYLYVPSPKTIFSGISKLKAGHYLKINNKGVENIAWFTLGENINLYTGSRKNLVDEIRFLLDDSVRLQMRSDVPVGAFLSGGLDSSIITALASRNTDLPLSTFSVGFENSEFDELPYAREVAKLFRTNHHELIVTPNDALKHLPELMKGMDEPIGDSAILPSYLVSKFAAQHLKVVLSGLGGDELFGGYSRYKPLSGLSSVVRRLPRPLLYGLQPFLNSLRPAWGKQIDRLINPPTPATLYHERVRQMSDSMICQVTGSSSISKFVGADVCMVYDQYPADDELNQRMYTDIRLYMSDQLLQLTDRTSMAASLEARVPLLDFRLVELSLSIPSSQKINVKNSKIILKDSTKDLLPARLLNRPKWGFAAPHKTWTRQNGFAALIDQVLDGQLVKDGILDRKGLTDFLGNPQLVEKFATWVWPLVALEVWYANSMP